MNSHWPSRKMKVAPARNQLPPDCAPSIFKAKTGKIPVNQTALANLREPFIYPTVQWSVAPKNGTAHRSKRQNITTANSKERDKFNLSRSFEFYLSGANRAFTSFMSQMRISSRARKIKYFQAIANCMKHNKHYEERVTPKACSGNFSFTLLSVTQL